MDDFDIILRQHRPKVFFLEHRALRVWIVHDRASVTAVVDRRKRFQDTCPVFVELHHAVIGMNNITLAVFEKDLSGRQMISDYSDLGTANEAFFAFFSLFHLTF